jgi:nucleoside diphosphate kinase
VLSGVPPLRAFLHALPDDDWAGPRRLRELFGDDVERLAFVLVRPEAVWQGFTCGIVDRLWDNGFALMDADIVHPHPRQLEELYRYTQVRLMSAGNRPMWWYTPRYYELGPAVALLVGWADRTAGSDRPGAAEAIAALKGPANPALTHPGQLRYDFRSQNMVMCVLHCSDATDTMLREACLFFGTGRVAAALTAGPAHQRHRAALAELDRGKPEPHFHQTLAELQHRIVGELAARGEIEEALAGQVLDRLEKLTADGLDDLRYERRTERLLEFWTSAPAAPLLATIRHPEADDAAFLAWSSRLVDTSSALADLVLSRLVELGYRLTPYQHVLLETGLGFHPWIASRFRPATDEADLVRAELGPAAP